MKTFSSLKLALVTIGFVTLSSSQPVYSQMVSSSDGVIQRVLNVTGEGKVNIPTTITQVSLGVERRMATAQEAQEAVAASSQALVELLKDRGVNKLQTTGIRLNPNYEYTEDRQRLIGYTATNLVSFEVETSQAGNILDAAVRVGATRIDSVSFMATENAIAIAQQEAIQKAVQSARQQGDTALRILNLNAQEVVGISINNASGMPPQPRFRQQALSADQSFPKAVTAVEGGEQEVNASVTLHIRY